MIRTLLFFLLFLPYSLAGQNCVSDTNYTVRHLVDEVLSGSGVRTGNIKLTGIKVGIGKFLCDTPIIGMKEGLVLTTGTVEDAVHPNSSPRKSGIHMPRQGRAAKGGSEFDMDLMRLAKGETFDLLALEFDFIPYHNEVSFNFSFGSEEYREYVNSVYNDVFAFIVEGPGLPRTNLAVTPETGDPVTVNSINHQSNSKYYLDNPTSSLPDERNARRRTTGQQPHDKYQRSRDRSRNRGIPPHKRKNQEKTKWRSDNFEFDGFTTVMTASFHAQPYKKYHMKIAIADVGDRQYDSGVFLESGSFKSRKDTTHPDYEPYEDQSASFDFDRAFGKASASPKKIREEFRITNVYFETDKDLIPDSAKTYLTNLADYLQQYKGITCTLEGYTDLRGNRKYNQNLSEKRAAAVMRFLAKQGIRRERMNYQGNNFMDPIGDNTTAKGRAMNRRVEIELHIPGEDH